MIQKVTSWSDCNIMIVPDPTTSTSKAGALSRSTTDTTETNVRDITSTNTKTKRKHGTEPVEGGERSVRKKRQECKEDKELSHNLFLDRSAKRNERQDAELTDLQQGNYHFRCSIQQLEVTFFVTVCHKMTHYCLVRSS